MGQDLRQLLRVQPQEVGGPAESCSNTNTQQTVQVQNQRELNRKWWNAAGSSVAATGGERRNDAGELHLTGRVSRIEKTNKQTSSHCDVRSTTATGGDRRVRPDLEETCAPPAVMNSMFPVWRIPTRRRRISLMFSSVNCIIRMELCSLSTEEEEEEGEARWRPQGCGTFKP